VAGEAPGFGEQPHVPGDATDLPPQWRAESDTATQTDGTNAETAEAGDATTERPRRSRRPRRERETAEPSAAAAPAVTAAPVEPAAPASPMAPAGELALAERSVTVIEVKDSGEAVAASVEDDPNQPKKRGWWRRLIE